MRRVIIMGAATSAGTHHAGQERTPEALRAGGFTRRLEAAGLAVTDLGDVVRETFRVDRSGALARNQAAVVRTAGVVAGEAERAAADDAVLVVLGGDCTITLGVLAGLQRTEPETALVYFDGDADLGMPGRGSGIMDAMGIAHLLGLAETGLTGLFATRPPIAAGRLALLGYDETDPDSFVPGVFAARPGLTCLADHAVRADPAGCARTARAATAAAPRLIVHFDVDAVNSGDLPLGNFPHYGTGVPLTAAGEVLSVLFAAPRLSAVVLTEVNPSYDPHGDSLSRYIETVTGALISGLAG
ncbi:MAG TPA: arginase family protein [Trebonia sp.]|nr:arginase family protein [Trebonia sp.]